MNISQLSIGMLVSIRKHRDNNSPIGRIRIKKIEECINNLFIKINDYIYFKCQIESIILESTEDVIISKDSQFRKLENDYWHLLYHVLENKKISKKYKEILEKEYFNLTVKKNMYIITRSIMRK